MIRLDMVVVVKLGNTAAVIPSGKTLNVKNTTYNSFYNIQTNKNLKANADLLIKIPRNKQKEKELDNFTK
jgi:hypothetical protein